MELNAEQVKKAFEHCINRKDCSACVIKSKELRSGCIGRPRVFFKNALALIKSQEQRIRELTEENEAWQKQSIATEEKADKAYYELACEVEDLRKENKKLHASCTELTRKCASLTEENERLREQNERYAELEEGCYVTGYKNIKADTVRKMQERLRDRHLTATNPNVICLYESELDQIVKKISEGL